ncbi:MAG: hypothetical protein GEU97_12190 [Actinophytocola sp.]|nr:hypothetical protein [Actinophytocola sp.]
MATSASTPCSTASTAGPSAQLFGAQFDSHPHGAAAPPARVVVEDRTDPTMAGWSDGESFQMADEYYRWRGARGVPGISLPRDLPGTEVLLSLDETSVADGVQDGAQPYEDNQPIAWKRTYGEGRVFYNNMGHNESTWSVPAFQLSLVNAIDWLAGVRQDQTCPVPAMRETNATADFRAVHTTDSQALNGGIPGNLAWGAQTWVVDLSPSRARAATVTIDLDWPLPSDDYDLSVTTGWGYYGSDNPAGTPHEQVVIEDVPHCGILQVAGDNMLAPSMSGTTASIEVAPQPRKPGPVSATDRTHPRPRRATM